MRGRGYYPHDRLFDLDGIRKFIYKDKLWKNVKAILPPPESCGKEREYEDPADQR
jgi:hypothetical protein